MAPCGRPPSRRAVYVLSMEHKVRLVHIYYILCFLNKLYLSFCTHRHRALLLIIVSVLIRHRRGGVNRKLCKSSHELREGHTHRECTKRATRRTRCTHVCGTRSVFLDHGSETLGNIRSRKFSPAIINREPLFRFTFFSFVYFVFFSPDLT